MIPPEIPAQLEHGNGEIVLVVCGHPTLRIHKTDGAIIAESYDDPEVVVKWFYAGGYDR